MLLQAQPHVLSTNRTCQMCQTMGLSLLHTNNPLPLLPIQRRATKDLGQAR